jgi:Transposase DDE domain group 1
LAIWKCALRPGKVHSADGWDGALKPVVERYRSKVSRIYFRTDTGFANPDIYWFLQAERIQCAIRLTATRILQERIGHLLRRPIGPPPNEVRHPMQISFISRQAGQSRAGSSPRSSGIRANFIRTRVGFIVNKMARSAENVITLAMPERIKDWSLTGLKEKLIKIGAARKVLLGPAGNAGSFSVPVRLATMSWPSPNFIAPR